jgi:hypothetical protein
MKCRNRSLVSRLLQLEAKVREKQSTRGSVLELLRRDPAQLMTLAKFHTDPWQQKLLRSRANQILLLCSRQAGKSTIAAALAVRTALLQPKSLILILSPSTRQSGELFRKAKEIFGALGRPMAIAAESALRLELANGARIVTLPGKEGTVRGFSDVSLLIIDEAARVCDALYYSVRPMLAVSRGKLVALSTPFGKRGWYHDEWIGAGEWERIEIKADQVSRITPQFLAEEKRALGERFYMQEYFCSFCDVVDAVFAYSDIQAALSDDVQPLFPGLPHGV